MAKFTITNGFVQITDSEFRMNKSPNVGLKRFYQWNPRASYVFIILYIIAFAALLVTDVDFLVPNIVYIVIYSLLPVSIIGRTVVESFRSGPSTTIPREAVIRVEYDDLSRFKLSRIQVFYTEDGDEKDVNIWIRFFNSITGGEIESAITALESVGIETRQGKYSAELQGE